MFFILVGEKVIHAKIGPVDADRGIVPKIAALVLGMVKLRALIREGRCFRKDEEAVRETLRDVKLVLSFGA